MHMVVRSKRFVTSILVNDVTGKSHSFTFAPHANNITSDLQWLSNKGKPLQHDFVPLKEISAGGVIAELSRARSASSGAPRVTKFDKLSIRDNLVMT